MPTSAVVASRPFSIWDDARRQWLSTVAIEVIQTGVPGAFVECGVSHGGTAAILAAAILRTDRQLWLYDSFAGMPAPDLQKDGPEATRYTGENKATRADVLAALTAVSYPLDRVMFREGLFAETFREETPSPVAFLHLDVDWYDNVMACLLRWVPLMSDGGIVVLDAYGHWRGCRHAFYDWMHETGTDVVLNRGNQDQVWWRTGPIKQCGT